MRNERVVHVLDDNRDVRDSLTLLLQMEGYVVRAYACAEELICSLAHGASGCVITDIHMPGMSGLDVLRVLRSWDISIPVIVMSAHINNRLATEAKELGAVDFFRKPLDFDALLPSISRHVDGQSASYCANPLVCVC